MLRDGRIRLIVVFVFESEERPPGFAVLADHLLGGRRAEDALVLAFQRSSWGIPDIFVLEAVFVVVADEAFVVDLVPESGGSVQQIAEQPLIPIGERSYSEGVGSLHRLSIRSFGMGLNPGNAG